MRSFASVFPFEHVIFHVIANEPLARTRSIPPPPPSPPLGAILFALRQELQAGAGACSLLIRRLHGVLPGVGAIGVVDAGAALHGVAVGGEQRRDVNLGVGRQVAVVVVHVVVGTDAAIVSMAAGDGQRAIALELQIGG